MSIDYFSFEGVGITKMEEEKFQKFFKIDKKKCKKHFKNINLNSFPLII